MTKKLKRKGRTGPQSINKEAQIIPSAEYKDYRTPSVLRKKYRKFVKNYLITNTATKAYGLLVMDGHAKGARSSWKVCGHALMKHPQVIKYLNIELKKNNYIDTFSKEKLLFDAEEIKNDKNASPMVKLKAIDLQKDIAEINKKEPAATSNTFIINAPEVANELFAKRIGSNFKVIEGNKIEETPKAVNADI